MDWFTKWAKHRSDEVAVRETPYGEWAFAGKCIRCYAPLRASGLTGEFGVHLMQLLTCEQCGASYTLEVKIKRD